MPDEYPLHWPEGWKRTTSRKSAAFSSHGNKLTYARAEERLRKELNMLSGNRRYAVLVISSNMIRDRQPPDPGAAVYFQEPGGPMRVMASDIYDRVEDNVGALAATIEAMRSIQRHGGSVILERAFTGFTALAAPKSCWDVLGVPVGSSGAIVRDAFRKLAAVHHPDKPTGNANRMAEINQAKDEALAASERVVR